MLMKDCDFSIIIPAYNNLELFKRALGSVLKQEKVSFEIIVVDDSINDDIETYVYIINQPSIRYYHNHPSKGAIANWNYGLSLAQGEYVEILHHDEALESENILSEVKQQFKMSQSTAVVANYQVFINGEAKKEPSIKRRLRSFFIKHSIFLFLANLLGPCACVFIKNSHKEFFDEKLRWFVDVEWYYRLLRKRKTNMLNPNFLISSIHGHQGQITETINIQSEAAKDARAISKKYHSFFINILLKINKLLNSSLSNRIIKYKR